MDVAIVTVPTMFPIETTLFASTESNPVPLTDKVNGKVIESIKVGLIDLTEGV